MNTRLLALSFITLFLGLGQRLFAAEAPAVATKPGYNVVVDIAFDETGVPQTATIVESDDPTSDNILHRVAIALAKGIKQSPRLKDGKPVPFVVRAPFNFPVEDDEGAAANNAPKPIQSDGLPPIYPANLAAAGVVGGAILELHIGADGKVNTVNVLRASHPEFAQSAETAVKTWVYSPAKKDGVPVESRWRIAIAFSVDGKEVDWKWRVAPRPNLGGSIKAIYHEPAPSASTSPPVGSTPAAPTAPAASSPVFTLPPAPAAPAPAK